MSVFLRGLDLSNGSEVVDTQIEMNAGDLTATNFIGIGAELSGQIVLTNTNPNQVEINLSTESTEDFNINLENTKATLEDGDILVYNTANGTFKVDNISNYAGGGTGNYHVLVVDFLENEDYATTTIVPEGAQIDRLRIYRAGSGLTNGIEPLIFSIGDVSNITLATQGIEFDNSAGGFTVQFFNDDIDVIVGTGEAGTFRSNWSGAGFGTGNGKAYLFYWTPLP